MRYQTIAAAALGLLGVGEAAVCSSSYSRETTTYTAASSASTCQIENVDFANKLQGYKTTGDVSWVKGQGYGNNKNGACQLQTDGDDDDDDDEDESSVEKRQAITGTSVSTTVRGLTAGSAHTVEFYYYVILARPSNSCRLRVYFDGTNIANTDRFSGGFFGSSWSKVSASVTPRSRTGTVTVSVNCNNRGLARVYIDRISVTRSAVTTTARSSTTSRISSSSSSSAVVSSVAPSSAVASSVASSSDAASSAAAESSTAAASSAAVESSTAAASSAAAESSTVAASSDAASSTAAESSASDTSVSAAASSSDSSSASSVSTEAVSPRSETTTTAAATTSDASSATSAETSSTPSSAATSESSSATTSESSSAVTSSESSSVTTSATSTTTDSTSSATTSSATSSATALDSGTVDSTILIIARDATTAELASSGLLAYGIPFSNLIVPQDGVTLPELNSSATSGNYGGIIVLDAVSYEYEGSVWRSAITDDQWTAIHNYQTAFNVRMVRINDYPGSGSGSTPVAGGCCGTGVEQSVFFSDVTDFPTANLKANAELSTTGLYHVPASITDSSTTRAVAKFGVTTGFSSESVAAVINNFNGREQWVWFMSWAPSWSITSSYLQHGHIHWMTRGLFLGKRKVHLNAQIDDVQLSTEPYYPAGQAEVKIDVSDLEAHVDWQKNLATRLPTGSDFWLELAHNGNGDLIAATLNDTEEICIPDEAVYYDTPVAAANEWIKPLGSGEDVWPTSFTNYSWTETCAAIDDFADWFTIPDNLNEFGHISHTFTHLNLNNATYNDTRREIQFNQAWMAQMGIDQATKYSPNGLIPPQITGLYNGDAIKAWMDNGIYYVVGDNTRPQTRNTGSVYWPLITTVANNGYDGLTIIPRFSTRIYYNCHTAECDLQEWIDTSAGSGDFSTLLGLEKDSVVRNLFALQSDPYMFHQANMYQRDVETITIGTQTGKFSLVQSWTETVLQEFTRLTSWPVISLTQDDLAHYFLDRKTVDDCNPKLSYKFSGSGTIESVTVSADGNTCAKPIPVTIPSGSVSGGSVTADVVGSEPPIQWVTLSGSAVTLTLSSPVTL